MTRSRSRASIISSRLPVPRYGRLARLLAPVALSVLLVLLVGSSLAADARMLILRKTYGTVEVRRAGSAGWIAANDRMMLGERDALRTGDQSWAIVEISRLNYVKVEARTQVVVKRAERATATSSRASVFNRRAAGVLEFELVRGTMRPLLDNLQARTFRLLTPVAAIGVRGTRFSATVEEVGGARPAGGESPEGMYNVEVEVYAGQVEITDLRAPDAPPFQLPAGQSIAFRNVSVPRGGFGGPGGPGGAGRPGGPGGAGGPGGGGPGTQGGPTSGPPPSGAQTGQASSPGFSMPPPAAMGQQPPPNFQPPPP